MNKIYIRNADGTVTVWEKDIFDRPRRAFSQRVPRTVIDAFQYHGCDRIESDGFFELQPIFTEPRTVVVERRVEVTRPVVVERHHHHRDNSMEGAMLLGAMLGGAIGGAIEKRRQRQMSAKK